MSKFKSGDDEKIREKQMTDDDLDRLWKSLAPWQRTLLIAMLRKVSDAVASDLEDAAKRFREAIENDIGMLQPGDGK